MKLGKRNFLYSMILAAVMLLLLAGYFVYMLPSLYVEYVTGQNLQAIKEQHNAFSQSGSYDDVALKNPTACFSIKIPDKGNKINLTTKFMSAEIIAKDECLQEMFEYFRSLLKAYEKDENTDLQEIQKQIQSRAKEWEKMLDDILSENLSLPVEIRVLNTQNLENEYRGEYEKVHLITNNVIIFETGIEDANNKYVNYIAVEQKEDALLLSFLPFMTPDMNEIRPVVLQSLPMPAAVICLLVLLFSQAYSRGIVTPVVRLVEHTRQMKSSGNFVTVSMKQTGKKRKDEIGILAETIDDLYQKIRNSYEELEEKNQILSEENKRQEVLLRASSHQLKTPVAAALLLVDGMQNNVGKYKDREKYLPKVKEQLLSMKKMVEDLLYLNHCGENMEFHNLDTAQVLKAQIAAFSLPAAEKGIRISCEGLEERELYTDEAVLSHILGNLLSNGIKYTPHGGRIHILLEKEKLTVQNDGAHIDKELLPHIFEPFVSGNHAHVDSATDSHGLGLYIAAYYAKKLGMEIHISNEGESVLAVLVFPQ